ncbi:MAG: phosphoribosyl-ATP diphosphatase [Planctomycetales bacterium 12-60-4]|nr:MAG: phosphoribosyl-ATP diphosphatase [Planctomycetales bacterium 12-60-4]
MSDEASIVARLAAVIRQRHAERPAGSYTVELFEAGHATISSKVIEEAYELIATVGEDDDPNRADVAHEAADVIYHLLVFLAAAGVDWCSVERELQTRFGVSGLAERARRPL